MAMDYTALSKSEQDALLDRVYETAKKYESDYGNCPQCVLGAMYDVFGAGDEGLFKASCGLAGGTGLTSLNGCGALAGAVLFISWYCGRTYEEFATGRAKKCYDLSKRALEHFVQKYGGPLCRDVQTCIMGRSYDLNVREDYKAFLAAGGHEDKCPAVCGDTCRFLAELLFSGELS